VQFGQRTGFPVLASTSLNLRGDPIARGEADATAVFERSGLDLLAVEGEMRERG
jgi:predicted NodU family carbamoyl transferase